MENVWLMDGTTGVERVVVNTVALFGGAVTKGEVEFSILQKRLNQSHQPTLAANVSDGA